MSVHIDYETFPPVDGTVADVYEVRDDDIGNHIIYYAGTMVYSKDLDQWNDCEFPGDVANKDAKKCAESIIEFRNKSKS